MSGSLEPVTQVDTPEPNKPVAKKATAAQVIGGLPGTLTAIAIAVTGAITAVNNYQEQQANREEQRALSKASYEALKTATDHNTEQLTQLGVEMKRHQEWTRSIAEAVRELQAKAPAPEREVAPLNPPGKPLDEPPAVSPRLPRFDQLKKD